MNLDSKNSDLDRALKTVGRFFCHIGEGATSGVFFHVLPTPRHPVTFSDDWDVQSPPQHKI